MLQTTDLNSESLPSTHQANNLSENTVTNARLLTFLKILQNKIDRLENKKPSANINNTSNINPRTGTPFKRYCFSCGYCQYWGKDCLNKKSRHPNNVTFKNRMRGSNDNCMPNRT